MTHIKANIAGKIADLRNEEEFNEYVWRNTEYKECSYIIW